MAQMEIITISLIFAVIGTILLYLSFQSPETDLIVYFFGGLFFLFACVSGFAGYSDIQTGQQITYTYINFNGSNVIDTEIKTPIYSNSPIFNTYLNLLYALIAIYIFTNILTNGRNRRTDKS